MSAIILDALALVLEVEVAQRALEQALESARLTQPPRHPTALRYFLDRTLRFPIEALEDPRIELAAPGYDLLLDHIVFNLETLHPRRDYVSGTRPRQRPSSVPPEPASLPALHRLLLVTVDPRVAARMAEELAGRAEVTRVQSVADLALLLDLAEEGVSAALVVDAVLSTVALPVLAAMAPALPSYCPVVVVGVPEAGWARLRALHADIELWQRCDSFDDLEPSFLLPSASAPR